MNFSFWIVYYIQSKKSPGGSGDWRKGAVRLHLPKKRLTTEYWLFLRTAKNKQLREQKQNQNVCSAIEATSRNEWKWTCPFRVGRIFCAQKSGTDVSFHVTSHPEHTKLLARQHITTIWEIYREQRVFSLVAWEEVCNESMNQN